MIYQSFARFYDDLFDDHLYEEWQQYVEKRCPEKTAQVLDLAGGAGRLGVRLAKKGYRVTDLDFSEDMLTLAQAHSAKAHVPLNLICADMTDLDGLGQYDLVTCFADSLNYLENIDQVAQSMQQVYAHLKVGGKYLFDMITPYQTDVVYPGYMYNYQDDDGKRALMWASYQDDDVIHGVIHELTFFYRQDNGLYKRGTETHFERAYDMSTVVKAVQSAGFAQPIVTSDFGQHPVSKQTTRWFFECQKVD